MIAFGQQLLIAARMLRRTAPPVLLFSLVPISLQLEPDFHFGRRFPQSAEAISEFLIQCYSAIE